jgi:hypothetical protein
MSTPFTYAYLLVQYTYSTSLDYAFAYAFYNDTSMGHYTWYLVPCNELWLVCVRVTLHADNGSVEDVTRQLLAPNPRICLNCTSQHCC